MTNQKTITENLYEIYVETGFGADEAQEARLTSLSANMDQLIQGQSVNDEAIADYEEAARRAGFYAGIKAALLYLGQPDKPEPAAE